MSRALILFFLFLCPSYFSRAQQTPGSAPPLAATDPDNKHVKVTRFTIAPHELLTLPKLANESVLICLRGEQLSRIPENGSSEGWCTEPGNAIGNRGGVGYRVENGADSPAEFLQIELKDSYALNQIRVPYSERDPLVLDPRAFRIVLENEDVRLLRMHLDARQSTDELELPMRLEIALQAAHLVRSDSYGKANEVHPNPGDVIWEKAHLLTITNSGDKPLDHLLLELKHPFCYPHGYGLVAAPGTDPNMEPYVRKVHDAINKKWIKETARVARDEERGLVTLTFNIDRDGTISEDDIRINEVFASEAIATVALNAIRKAAPFPPLPPTFTKPKAEMRFIFLTNLPTNPSGCSE